MDRLNYNRAEYDNKCIKVAELYDKYGVERFALRERYGATRTCIDDMISRGRKLIKGKAHVVQNSSRRVAERAERLST